MTPVIYLAHQLFSETRDGIEANRLNACRWGAWIEQTFGVAVTADWLWLTGVLDETEENRRRGLANDCTRLERADWFWMCGGKVSHGMGLEHGHAVDCMKPVLDLTRFGYEPPYVGSDYEAEIIQVVRKWMQEARA